MILRSLLFFSLIPALYWLSSCASIKAPEGGPKDSTAPKLVAAVPISGSTQFSGKSISLEFSEDVAEHNPKQYFLSPITPVSVFEGNRKLKISPDSGFLPNTTYSLRIQKKIKDTREGNYVKDTTIVFTTGSEIDTLFLRSGIRTVSNEVQRKPSLVLIQSERQKKYFALSDSTGKSTIQNIPKGKYYVETFLDANENYKYEEEEKNLYFDTIIIDSIQEYNIQPLPHKSTSIKIFKQRRGDTLSIEGQEFINLSGSIKKNLVYQNKTKTVYRFLTGTSPEIFETSDSLGNCQVDTLDPLSIDSTRSLSTMPLEKTVEIDKEGKKILVTISYTWKIDIEPKTLEINYDSVWNSVPIQNKDFSLSFELKEKRAGKIRLRMDTISFYNKTGYERDSIVIDKADLDEKGSISGEILTNQNQPIVVELLDASKKQIALSPGKAFLFHVKPGKYSIQIFVDWNGDNLYTGGNRNLGRKAEPLFLYPKTIELKPGWDIENLRIDPGFN